MWDSPENKTPFVQMKEDEIIAIVNRGLSQGSRTTTYKFAFFKSILDNIFNVEILESNIYFLSFDKIAIRFSEIYWNLVLRCGLKQIISYDGKISAVEKRLFEFKEEQKMDFVPLFESISDENKLKISKIIKKEMLKNVVGAFCSDTEDQFYHFDKKNLKVFDGIELNPCVFEVFVKYKSVFEKQNYYEWILYLEKANKEEDSYKLAEKLDFSTKRSNLSEYRKVLEDFGQEKCFYCGRFLTKKPVDHFIPWSFVKDDKMWNFVLACQSCNSSKNDKLPKTFLEKIKIRNNALCNFENTIVQADFRNYSHELLSRLYDSALFNGFANWERTIYRIEHNLS